MEGCRRLRRERVVVVVVCPGVYGLRITVSWITSARQTTVRCAACGSRCPHPHLPHPWQTHMYRARASPGVFQAFVTYVVQPVMPGEKGDRDPCWRTGDGTKPGLPGVYLR